jgi:hypothetical protein
LGTTSPSPIPSTEQHHRSIFQPNKAVAWHFPLSLSRAGSSFEEQPSKKKSENYFTGSIGVIFVVVVVALQTSVVVVVVFKKISVKSWASCFTCWSMQGH